LLTNFAQIFRSQPSEPFTSLSTYHDGTPCLRHTSTVQIYDIRSGIFAATLTPPQSTPFTVKSLSFSENGYHLLAPNSHSSVVICDLRKQKATHSVSLGDNFKINNVLYDKSAQYLDVAGNEGVRVHIKVAMSWFGLNNVGTLVIWRLDHRVRRLEVQVSGRSGFGVRRVEVYLRCVKSC
jgi:WD40 repeat protein